MPNNINTLETDVVIPLKYFSNFWRFLDLSLINCETEPGLLWSKTLMICRISRKSAVPGNPDANTRLPNVAAIQTNGATCQTNNVELYVFSCYFVY